MKRTFAILLLVAMLICMLPVMPIVAADEVQYGLNADFWQLYKTEGVQYGAYHYSDMIGTTTNRDPWMRFDDVQRFDASIEAMLNSSRVVSTEEGLTGLTGLFGEDGYFIKWEGSLTAKTTGTYYFVGRKIDNGFVAFVEQGDTMKKVYEYWAVNHWFEGGSDYLYSNLGGFDLVEGETLDVEFWYYESDGGEALDIEVSSVENGDLMDCLYMDEVFDLSLTKTVYASYMESNHDRINAILPEGANPGQNGNQANAEANHKYSKDLVDSLKAIMEKRGTAVVPNFETAAFAYGVPMGYINEDCMIEYTGFVTPTVGGEFQFGTRQVDNCLFVEIEINGVWTKAYEFFAGRVWNDESETFYNETLTLEEGVSYPIHVVFLEVDGGQCIDTRVKLNGETKTLSESGLVFTTKAPTAPVGPTTVSFFDKGSEWYYMLSGDEDTDAPEANWATDASIYTGWNTANADLGEKGSHVWAPSKEESDVGNKGVWAVKEFTVEDIDALSGWSLMTDMFFDDNIHLYINGTEVFTHGSWNNGYERYKFVEDATDVLVEGKNVIAVQLWQGHGGYGIDLSLFATCEDTSIYTPTYVAPEKTDITLEAGKDFALYYQARDNGTKKDFRVIIVAKTEWLRDNYQKGFVITFSNGTDSKKLEAVPTVFYQSVTAQTADSYEIYSAVGDTVITGWIVTDVPEGYTPSITIGNNTYAA